MGDNLGKRGVQVHTQTNPTSVERHDDGTLTLHTALAGGGVGALRCDAVMFATGRAPATRGIGLEVPLQAAGCRLQAAGCCCRCCCRYCCASFEGLSSLMLPTHPNPCCTVSPTLCAALHSATPQDAGVQLDPRSKAVKVDEFSHTNVS